MSQDEQLIPTEINLHRKSRLLVISFSDGQRFELPCEYLRVFSQAAEVKTQEAPVIGKEEVNIEAIEPQGNYAIRLTFDDGHDTGIYSWSTLYQLGINQQANWQKYLERLKSHGVERSSDQQNAASQLQLKVLYFSYLVQKLRKDNESLKVPASVGDVTALLAWLRKKWQERGYLLADDNVRVTVNRQFAEPFTRIEEGDEIGITPRSPNPPRPPE
jgi:DUF971 family protein/molybdopterin converting factor small subunit